MGDVLRIETPAGAVEVPAFPRGGIRDDVIAVAIGQGHDVGRFAGRDGAVRGANVIAALPATSDERGGRAWLTARANVKPTGRFERLALTQTSDNKRGRQLGEAVTLAAATGAAEAHVPGAGEGGGHGDAHGGGHE